MEDIKPIIAKNISELRTARGLTQMELAEKLNYSDKAVSKWERAESIPDITVLTNIADLFGVPLDYLVRIHEGAPSSAVPAKTDETEKRIISKNESRKKRNHGFITGMCIILVWLIAMTLYMILDLTIADRLTLLVFAYAVPVSMIVWLVFNSIWFNRRLNFLIISLLMWSLLACIHLTLLPFGFNVWMMFILGVPGQIIILLWSMIKKKGDEDDEDDGEQSFINIDSEKE
ncbi:MAG: helix-turn-helix transcriptional regulator [Ruminococcaceae bacterium]|nr:helix-turn-helix transcriptional regulator [Oscillospiraceae bacterium]